MLDLIPSQYRSARNKDNQHEHPIAQRCAKTLPEHVAQVAHPNMERRLCQLPTVLRARRSM